MKKIIFIFLIISALVTVSSIEGAVKAKTKKTLDAETALQMGREAFLNYDFEGAADLYAQYKSLKTKAKKPLDEEFEVWETQLEIASGAFDRVQQIVVIDSIIFPLSSFYKAYRLASSAGKIENPQNLKLGIDLSTSELAFINEDRDFLITSEEGEDGFLKLVENRRLLDGTWESQDFMNDETDLNGDYAFPFMSGDGQTLYYANNGDDSMGGYDLFVVQKEPITGKVLQPLNLGMPFNSPYDDYLMAIDEENGLGWWATNRNSEEDKVTVYIYLLDEIRKNYPTDTPDLSRYARLDDIKLTQDSTKSEYYKKILRSLEEN